MFKVYITNARARVHHECSARVWLGHDRQPSAHSAMILIVVVIVIFFSF